MGRGGSGSIARLGGLVRRLFDQRAEPRERHRQRGAILVVGGRSIMVELADLSAHGAMIVGDEPLTEGQPVVLELLDRGPVRGQVRWAQGGRAGIHFRDGPGHSGMEATSR